MVGGEGHQNRHAHGQQHEDEIDGPGEDLRHLEPGAFDQDGYGRGRAEARLYGCQIDGFRRCGRIQLLLQLLRSGRLGAGCIETQQAARQDDQTYAERGEQQAISQSNAGKRQQTCIAFVRCPVTREVGYGPHAERIEPGIDVARQVTFIRQGAEGEIDDQHTNRGEVTAHHRFGQGRGTGKYRHHEQDRRQCQGQEGPGVIGDIERSDGFLVEPRHQCADDHAERHTQQAQGAHHKGAECATEDIVRTSDARGVKQWPESSFLIADDDIGTKGRGHEYEKGSQNHKPDGDDDRCVLVHIGARRDIDARCRHKAEGDEQENDERDPEGRALELVFQLKSGNGCPHVTPPLLASGSS